MIQVAQSRFEEIVADALDALPPQFTKLMRNVVVVTDDGADPHLLGLYTGIPLTERLADYSAALPDQITIYRLAICAGCDTEDEVAEEVRRTVVHEVGHHFGIDDERLHELGW
jgi:predicted Zn-dependent protease with MMP-like domain